MNDYGMIGKAMRSVGKHREGIGAKAVSQEMAEAKRDNAPAASEGYYAKRDKDIAEDIRERRRKRKEAE